MYRADYVKLHYVHYATATVVSQMSEDETKAKGLSWTHKYKESKDILIFRQFNFNSSHVSLLPAHLRSFFEVNEATMLHTKSKVAHNTMNWKRQCKIPTKSEHGCHLGFAYPIGANPAKEKFDKDGWAYNCYINEKIETYWWPRLVQAIKARG